jgi:hypothetical protein
MGKTCLGGTVQKRGCAHSGASAILFSSLSLSFPLYYCAMHVNTSMLFTDLGQTHTHLYSSHGGSCLSIWYTFLFLTYCLLYLYSGIHVSKKKKCLVYYPRRQLVIEIVPNIKNTKFLKRLPNSQVSSSFLCKFHFNLSLIRFSIDFISSDWFNDSLN